MSDMRREFEKSVDQDDLKDVSWTGTEYKVTPRSNSLTGGHQILNAWALWQKAWQAARYQHNAPDELRESGEAVAELFVDEYSDQRMRWLTGRDLPDGTLFYTHPAPSQEVPDEVVSEKSILVDLLRDKAMAEGKVDTCYDEPNKNPRLAVALNWLADWVNNEAAAPQPQSRVPDQAVRSGVPERLIELAEEAITDAAAEAQEGGEYEPVEWANIVVSMLSTTPQPADPWINCLCGSDPSIEVYEPCDDYPGNGTANWCVEVKCRRCGAHPRPIGVRFETEDEAYDAGKRHWNTFISGFNRPNPPAEGED